MRGRLPSVAVALLFLATVANGQNAPAAAAPAAAPSPSIPRVVKTICAGPFGAAGLGHLLTLQVEHFDQLLLESGGACHGINLFIDNMPVPLRPTSCSRQNGSVHFVLDRNPDDEKSDFVWHTLLGSPRRFVKNVRVSVGPNEQFSYPSNATFRLFVIPATMLYAFGLILLAALIGFVVLCRRTSIIRSPVAPPAGVAPYSLSRFQMAFWFFLVIGGYVFMWMITGELDTISESILALIGIGAGTALGSALIDAPTAPSNSEPAPPPRASRGFLVDVLTDSRGAVSIHRFQMFVWTVVLGVIFLASVYKSLSMPEFSATLLGLMGISSGTYLGFKFPEKRQQQEPPPNPAP